MTTLINDIKYALRQLRKSPGFTAVAVLTLALGIGACTAMFSLVHAVLLKPLPFREPERLVWIQNTGARGNLSAETCRVDTFLEWHTQNTSFEGLACYNAFFEGNRYRLTGIGEPQRLHGVRVSQNFFEVVGVQPSLGRGFVDEECVWNGRKVAILSHSFWQQKFGGDPGIVGQSMTVNGHSTLIAGVLPASFDFDSVFTPGKEVQLLLPFPLVEQTVRQGNTLFAIGRLKAGTTLDQAQADLDVICARARKANPDRDAFGARMSMLDNRIRGAFRRAFYVLSGGVVCVLLIACVNLSNLLLARANARSREFSVRIALGATRGHLVWQTMAESLILALAGCAPGLLIAYLGVTAAAKLQAFSIPFLHISSVDVTALAFTIGVACIAAFLCGVLPALQLHRSDVGATLSQSGSRGGTGRRAASVRRALVISEIALACVLLVSAGLLVRSFVEVLRIDLGFQPEHTLAFRVDSTRLIDPAENRTQYYDRLVEHVSAVPGIESVGLTDALPLGRGNDRDWSVAVKSPTYDPDNEPSAWVRIVDQRYLQTLRTPLRSGRYFDDRDAKHSQKVVIVNSTLARRLWPDRDPIGQTLNPGMTGDHTVIGVVADVPRGLEEAPQAEMYVNFRQTDDWDSIQLVVRSARAPASFIPDVRAAIREFDPSLPSNEFATLDQILDRAMAPRSLITATLGSFSSIALVLAVIGLYGVIAYSVSQRTREMGVRLAIGAQRSDILRLVIGEGFRIAGIAVFIGLFAAFLVTRLLRGLLFGVTASDPFVFGANAIFLMAVALLACWLPARRAAKIDPMAALRYE